MMKKIVFFMFVVLFLWGISVPVSNSLYASPIEKAPEEATQEEFDDTDELERQIEEEGEEDNNPGYEDEVQEEEEQSYPDEKYQDNLE